MYNILKEYNGVEYLTTEQDNWLENYLSSIEEIDSQSDLFLYPFDSDFLDEQKYRDRALDMKGMSRRLIYCYSMLNKLLYNNWYKDMEVDVDEDAQFVSIAKTAMNNCFFYGRLLGMMALSNKLLVIMKYLRFYIKDLKNQQVLILYTQYSF